ncbi:MAG: YaeQ family protein [SAR324 cluster bacterium]|nr:YaeQ family protein [SAR324 cluster bacterium]
MALKANIAKVNLTLSNINDHYYEDYRLTLAQHPSETDLRMIIRLAAFGLFASEGLEFTKGISTDEEPDIWSHKATGEIEHWIDLGQPTEKRIRQSISKAEKITIVGYHKEKFSRWFKGLDKKFLAQKKLEIYFLESVGTSKPEDLVQKTMDLSCTIQEDQMLLGNETTQVTFLIAGPLQSFG